MGPGVAVVTPGRDDAPTTLRHIERMERMERMKRMKRMKRIEPRRAPTRAAPSHRAGWARPREPSTSHGAGPGPTR